MIQFTTIDVTTFLNEYWQKKPLVIRNALPNFVNPLTADELAGLALEEDIESRMVFSSPHDANYWDLKTGPFEEEDFATLPNTHWTLLVQGVDRVISPVMDLLDHFNFIPQWRIDDVMISYAVEHGSVGPHYDNYDVFLYQAAGRRKWSLTTQRCNQQNYLPDTDLRIMAEFFVEEEYILESGDMLYLPPHIGHYGVSLDNDCMTYSFGYRSYQGQEIWDSFGDYLSEKVLDPVLYKDPNWTNLKGSAEIPKNAWLEARRIMQEILQSDEHVKSWFGCFATRLDSEAEQQMPIAHLDTECDDLPTFIATLYNEPRLLRDPTCRMAYLDAGSQLFINGCEWNITGVSAPLIQYCANNRVLETTYLHQYLTQEDNQWFLYELWKLQWLQWEE